MATKVKSRKKRTRSPSRKFRQAVLGKPDGMIQPRVQQVGPEHFGIVAIDCAKAKSKWMLADFYGKILFPPTIVEHQRTQLELAIGRRAGLSLASQASQGRFKSMAQCF